MVSLKAYQTSYLVLDVIATRHNQHVITAALKFYAFTAYTKCTILIQMVKLDDVGSVGGGCVASDTFSMQHNTPSLSTHL